MLAAKGIDPASINSWDGFVKAAEAFKKDGVDPIAFGDSEGWPGNHIFNHLTRRLLTTDQYVDIAARTVDPSITSDVRWTDPQLVKAWQLFDDLNQKKLFTAGSLSGDFPTAANLFITGKAPFMTMGGWLLGMIEQINPKLNYGVIAFPTVEGGPGKQTELVTSGLVVTITKASKHPEEAKRFLEYLASEPVQKQYMEAVQTHTPYVYDTSSWAYGEGFKKLSAIVSEATSSAPFLDMLEDQSCNVPWVWTASQGILSGELTPEEAADRVNWRPACVPPHSPALDKPDRETSHASRDARPGVAHRLAASTRRLRRRDRQLSAGRRAVVVEGRVQHGHLPRELQRERRIPADLEGG